ncbi:MAG: NAD(P)H-dependent oxidoreductase [Coriobacteriaceae bacterium]|nr:NAD(P)H-dependent oxidoreductase [Coriobacteriaceae bacterium]
MKTILFVNSCLNQESSRTQRLADAVLDKMLEEAAAAGEQAQVEELSLVDAGIEGLDEETLAFRSERSAAKDFTHELFAPARQFREADEIVIAAPYWDLSFPAMLKAYIEQLCVNGLTFSYSEEGIPVGHCLAKRLTYVTTAGGYLGAYNMGFDYVAAVCKLYFGIEESRCISAEGLDIWGNDAEAILASAIAAL